MFARNTIIEFIINDISSAQGIDDIYNPLSLNKELIKKEISIKCDFIHFGSSILKKEISDALYNKANKNWLIYAYYVIEAFSLMDAHTFIYKIIDYCEKRTSKPRTEQRYMHHCLNRVVYQRENAISTSHLCYMCRELLKQIYPDDSTVSLERMISYVTEAKEACIPLCDKELITELCELYIRELKTQWEVFF